MKPFNLERAIAGDKVVFENGEIATYIGGWWHKLFWGHPDGGYIVTDELGKFDGNKNFNVYMAPTVKEWWGVRYKDLINDQWYCTYTSVNSEARALDAIKDSGWAEHIRLTAEPFLIKREEE